jgi:hypothetical protein
VKWLNATSLLPVAASDSKRDGPSSAAAGGKVTALAIRRRGDTFFHAAWAISSRQWIFAIPVNRASIAS